MKISAAGIENIRYPIHLRKKSGGHQQTVASICLHAKMPSRYRETCKTTFLSILNKYQDDIKTDIFPDILAEIKENLQAESATIEMNFPYFIEKKAPVSATASLMEYACCFTCSQDDTTANMIVSIWVPSTTLCPCSKEISDYGAHNQRAEINLNVKFNNFIWIEDLIKMVESGTSCEVYSLLKRPDEKYVTEKAYENPMFVEDVVRKVAELAMAHKDISWFSVGVESFESIHKHSAYAYTDMDAVEKNDPLAK